MPQIFAISGLIALIVCIVSLVALHLLPGKFQPIRDPVSYYIASRYGRLYQVQASASGISAFCLLAVFITLNVTLPVAGLIALGCYGLARICIVVFPADVHTTRTRSGIIHGILAVITFASIATATGVLTNHIEALARWHELVGWLDAANILTFVASVLFLVVSIVRRLHPIMGVVERGIYVGGLLWLGLVLLFAVL
ncbi:MAG: DUF998 domain-containing protein [Ktedonobacteraceae bacterium]|nr:DUF998 domain-containing protein [Ktedonobacteraceae bacterium]